MRLSPLQKYILTVCLEAKGKVVRNHFNRFYEGASHPPKDVTDVITKTLERLINRALLVGHGVRTPQKWYIKEVKLTPLGSKTARKLQGEQQKLPLG